MAPRNVQVAISVVTWTILSVGAASRFVHRGCEARRFPNAGDPVVLAQVLTARTLTARTPAVPAVPAALARVDP